MQVPLDENFKLSNINQNFGGGRFVVAWFNPPIYVYSWNKPGSLRPASLATRGDFYVVEESLSLDKLCPLYQFPPVPIVPSLNLNDWIFCDKKVLS